MRFKSTKEFYDALRNEYDSHKQMEEKVSDIEASEGFSKKTYDAGTLKRSFA